MAFPNLCRLCIVSRDNNAKQLIFYKCIIPFHIESNAGWNIFWESMSEQKFWKYKWSGETVPECVLLIKAKRMWGVYVSALTAGEAIRPRIDNGVDQALEEGSSHGPGVAHFFAELWLGGYTNGEKLQLVKSFSVYLFVTDARD